MHHSQDDLPCACRKSVRIAAATSKIGKTFNMMDGGRSRSAD